MTGLYQESHGLVGNSVYLPEKNRTYYLPGLKASDAVQIYGGEPIWVTFALQLSKFRVGCYMWIGCYVPIKNVTLPSSVPYRNDATCEERVDFAIRWLRGGMDLVLLYFNEPDHTGHG